MTWVLEGLSSLDCTICLITTSIALNYIVWGIGICLAAGTSKNSFYTYLHHCILSIIECCDALAHYKFPSTPLEVDLSAQKKLLSSVLQLYMEFLLRLWLLEWRKLIIYKFYLFPGHYYISGFNIQIGDLQHVFTICFIVPQFLTHFKSTCESQHADFCTTESESTPIDKNCFRFSKHHGIRSKAVELQARTRVIYRILSAVQHKTLTLPQQVLALRLAVKYKDKQLQSTSARLMNQTNDITHFIVSNIHSTIRLTRKTESARGRGTDDRISLVYLILLACLPASGTTTKKYKAYKKTWNSIQNLWKNEQATTHQKSSIRRNQHCKWYSCSLTGYKWKGLGQN